MGLFNKTIQETGFSFTTPFSPIGESDLSQPYISSTLQGISGHIRYGADDLYPNTLRQLWHKSPLVGSIINFLTNATVGGGVALKHKDAASGKDKVEAQRFLNILTRDGLIDKICKDAIRFESINIIVTTDGDGHPIKMERVPQDEVRWKKGRKEFYHSKDFRLGGIETLAPYKNDGKKNSRRLLNIRLDDGDVEYPIPSWASCGNWAFLDGESSFLHKSNIQNSIFPTVAFLFPKKPQTDKEKTIYQDTIASAKGAANAGKAFAFFENGKENLPDIHQFNTSNNDKLFLQTDERMDTKICQAFTIDPILMGIRVSGKLGSGSDIKQAYTILEKNKIKPLRKVLDNLINTLALDLGIPGNFSIMNYQIINEEIELVVEDASQKTINALNSMSPLLATKVLESLTQDEIRALAGLSPAVVQPITQ